MRYLAVFYLFLTSITWVHANVLCNALTSETATEEAAAIEKIQELYELDLNFVLRVPNRGPYALYLLENLGWHYHASGDSKNPWFHDPHVDPEKIKKAHKTVSALKVLNDLYFSMAPAFSFLNYKTPLSEPFDIHWDIFADDIRLDNVALFDLEKSNSSLFVFLEKYLGYEYKNKDPRLGWLQTKPTTINPSALYVFDYLKYLWSQRNHLWIKNPRPGTLDLHLGQTLVATQAANNPEMRDARARIPSPEHALSRTFYFLRQSNQPKDEFALLELFRLLERAFPSDFNLNPKNLRIALIHYIMTGSLKDDSTLKSKKGNILPEVFLAMQIGQLVRYREQQPDQSDAGKIRAQALAFFKRWMAITSG